MGQPRLTKVPPGFIEVPQGFSKVAAVSRCLWSSGAGPVLGCQKVPPRFRQGYTKLPPGFHQGCASFVISLILWGRTVLGCQKVPRKVPRGCTNVPPIFHQRSTKVSPRFHQGCCFRKGNRKIRPTVLYICPPVS